jgi:hypothetical protein
MTSDCIDERRVALKEEAEEAETARTVLTLVIFKKVYKLRTKRLCFTFLVWEI